MNIKLLLRTLSAILLVEAAAMIPSLLIALLYGDGDWMAFLITIALLLMVSVPFRLFCRPESMNLRAREGFLSVALSWVLLSLFGALPFVISSVIPDPIDAFFEAVSGFSTTGATIMPVVENQPHGIMFWRSFMHWIGGMGVLVLTLAILPQMSGRTSHLVRAESPGPTLSKVAPRMGDTAKILYLIYAVMTLLNWLLLLIAGMNPYDAAITAFGTAGTGGFSNYAASIGHFGSVWVEVITTFFMVIFGVNFVLYYKLITGSVKEFFASEELKWYLAIYAGVTLLVSFQKLPGAQHYGDSLRLAAFQTASLMSTTGYATTNFDLWPAVAKLLLIIVMFTGGSAGSTAGGLKICRIGMLSKCGMREVRRTFQPRKVQLVRFEGKTVDEGVLQQVTSFFFTYMLLLVLGTTMIGFDCVGFAGADTVESHFTAALTCISNVGPGMGVVGPAGNFSGYGPVATTLLSFLMLAGRLEIFPMLALFHPAMWRK